MKSNNNQKFYTVAQFCEKQELTQGAVRMWIFNAKTNGFNKCIYRVGKKILISESKFHEWMGGSPDCPEEEVMSDKKTIESYLKVNRSILSLSDEYIGKLFETGPTPKFVQWQRIHTTGMIDALELVLGIENMDESLKHLNMMIQELNEKK